MERTKFVNSLVNPLFANILTLCFTGNVAFVVGDYKSREVEIYSPEGKCHTSPLVVISVQFLPMSEVTFWLAVQIQDQLSIVGRTIHRPILGPKSIGQFYITNFKEVFLRFEFFQPVHAIFKQK